MKKLIFVLLFFAGLHTFGQGPSGISLADSAELFGSGVITDGDFSFNASFTPDGRTVYFSKATANFGYIVIFYSVRNGQTWSKPRPVPFTGIYRDTDPFVSADGKRLYFSSDRPINGMPYKDYDYHYFYVELDGNRVISAVLPFNLPAPAAIKPSYLSFTNDGDAYFFSTDSTNDADIYYCARQGEGYAAPVALPFNDKKFFDFDPVIAGDGSFLIFCSSNRPGFGSGDIWISFRVGQGWSVPYNLGPKVNTRGNDGAPGLSRDQKTLYFTSFRETTPRPTYGGKSPTDEEIIKLMHSTADGLRHIYCIRIGDIRKP